MMHFIRNMNLSKYPILKNLLIAIVFGILSYFLGEIKFYIPGSTGGTSDLREVPLLLSVIFLPNWIYLVITCIITSLGTPEGGSYIATFVMHIIAVPVAWFFYRLIDDKIKNNFLLGLLWVIFVIFQYLIILLPLFIITYEFFGLLAVDNFFQTLKNIIHLTQFEILTSSLVSALFIVIIRMNKILQQRIQWHNLILKNANIGFWSRNVQQNSVVYHHQWAEMLGYDIHEVQANPEIWKSLLHPVDKEEALKKLHDFLEGKSDYYFSEYRLRTKSGDWKWILDKGQVLSRDEHGKIIQIAGTHLDVTDTIKMQEMMIQNEKMLSVGGLAAGMAHEINNPLAGMMQNASVIVNRLTKASPKNLEVAKELGLDYEKLNEYLEERNIVKMATLILETGKRAAEIIQNMLSFARKSESHFKEVNINESIDETIKLVENDFNMKKHYDFRKIEIIRNYNDSIPKIMVQDTKIKQVIMNILKNGAEAMVEDKIANNKENLCCFIINTSLEKNYIRLEIENNGPPIPDEVKKRIFEPFFTTKEEGKGTGLGLSISYFIITKDHSGEMYVESDESYGTRFIIKLPVKR